MTSLPKITIGIKALNEERHIGAALESAVRAVAPYDGDVVLADSGSTDRTIEIARQHPVRVVQLANPDERSCGAGAQLAFQFARGDYFYLLDGDMVVNPDFIPAALAYLDAHPDCAAVGGWVREMHTESLEFQIRAKSFQTGKYWVPGDMDRLDGGGLYRAEAVRGVGFFADRNLHGFEEFELGSRLKSAGWKLARIDVAAVDHYGHQTEGYKLLLRRMKTGYAGAPGEVLRSAMGRANLGLVLGNLNHIRYGVAVMAWWAMILAAPFVPVPVWLRAVAVLALIALPVAILSARRGAFKLGLYSLSSWNVTALGVITGFFRKRVAPTQPISAVVLQDI